MIRHLLQLVYSIYLGCTVGAVGMRPPAMIDYCVVGAGPAGLQAAIYLHQLGMQYMVFERYSTPGLFFARYPRHRILDSINKIHLGTADTRLASDEEFRLRFDWNSLLTHIDWGDAPARNKTPLRRQWLRFKDFSSEFHPHADAMVAYLGAVAKVYELRIAYNRTVWGVFRSGRTNFALAFESPVQRPVECRTVIMATGRDVPVRLQNPVAEMHVDGYEAVSVDSDDFVNQSVLILGGGNSALETADSIAHTAAGSFVASRITAQFAHQTHYPGHVRSRNMQVTDRYQFKSLDVLLSFSADFNELEFQRDPATSLIKIVKRANAPLIKHVSESSMRVPFHRVIRCMGFTWNHSAFVANRTFMAVPWCLSNAAECQGIIAGGSVEPLVPFADPRDLFMEVASNFESVNVPHLFVAGALMHFRDYKRTAGGFIHGFRYLTRTLVLQLRERYERLPYPSTGLGPYSSVTAAGAAVASFILARLSNVSSLIHLPGYVGDVLLWDFDPVYQRGAKDGFQMRYLRDVPMDQARSRNPDVIPLRRLRNALTFLTITVEYGPEYHGWGVLSNYRQHEFHWRVHETSLWGPESDPDVRRNLSRVNHLGSTTEAPLGTDELDLIPDDDVTGRSILRPEVTGFREAASGRGYNKLHPVFRLYTRARQRPMHDQPSQLMEYALPEDVTLRWGDRELHTKPLTQFLVAAVKRLTQQQ